MPPKKRAQPAKAAQPKPKPQPKKGGGKKDTINQDKIEREYGLSYALFASDPELKALLKKAVGASWTAQRFQVELRQTNWFKKHSESWRQMTALKYSDPEEYASRLAQAKTSVENLAAAYGAQNVDLGGLTERSLLLGWNEDQIRDALANHVTPMQSGHYGGQLASIEQSLRATALNNGVRIADADMQNWMRNIVRGNTSTEQYETMIRDIAAQTFSAYGEQIKGGMDVKDLASPYIQSMSQILELNAGSIDLYDSTIRNALSFQNEKGENVPMSISAFEKSLRQDRRWGYTKQAKDAAKGFGEVLGRMWGQSA